MKTKPQWLSRDTAYPGPFLRLCLDENEFYATLRSMKVKGGPGNWCRASAVTHFFDSPTNQIPTAVVCLGPHENKTSIQIAALLVHEAVHIWQEYCRAIGESHAGDEHEAYGVQTISQTLMHEYARRLESSTGKKNRKGRA